MTVRWKAPMLRGIASLKGNREVDFSSWEGVRFPDQSQIVDGPIPGWKAVRCEVKFGDKDPRYSDSRIILNASPSKGIGRVDEGDETWTRFCEMWPENWIGYFPKWDQLEYWPNIKHHGGSSGEWHHGPLNEDWSNFGGSAPIYMGATDKDVNVRINKYVSGQWGVPDTGYTLAPLQRGKWYDHIVHGIWSTDPAKGLLEFFIDGKLVATHKGATMFPNCYNWFLVGLYRNYNIGAQVNINGQPLVWPVDAKPGVDYGRFVPKKGQLVYPEGDGMPQQVYLTGLVIGTTRDDVANAYASPSGATVPDPTQPPAVTPTPSPVPATTDLTPQVATQNLPVKAVDGLKQLIAQRQQLEPLIPKIEAAVAQMQAATVQMQNVRDAAKKVLDDTVTILNRGPW